MDPEIRQDYVIGQGELEALPRSDKRLLLLGIGLGLVVSIAFVLVLFAVGNVFIPLPPTPYMYLWLAIGAGVAGAILGPILLLIFSRSDLHSETWLNLHRRTQVR